MVMYCGRCKTVRLRGEKGPCKSCGYEGKETPIGPIAKMLTDRDREYAKPIAPMGKRVL